MSGTSMMMSVFNKPSCDSVPRSQSIRPPHAYRIKTIRRRVEQGENLQVRYDYNHSFYDRKGVLFFDNFWDGKVEKLFFIIEDVECAGFRSNTVNNQMKILWSESQLTELKELENLIKEPLNKEDTFYLDCRFKLENGLVVQDFGLESADETLNWKTLIGIPFHVKHLVVSYELIDGTSRLVCRCLNLVSIC